MRQEILRKIADVTTLTCWDHHKTRDGVYEIAYSWDQWAESGSWYVSHPGYIWEWHQSGYPSFESAEAALEYKLNREIKNQLDWIKKHKDEVDDGWFTPPPAYVIEKAKELGCRLDG